MKAAAPLAALAGLAAAAADLAALQKALPACSLVCLVQGVAEHGCAVADFACQCARLEPIIRTVAPCLVRAGCSLENITATARVVLDVCKNEVPDSVRVSAPEATAPAAAVSAAAATLWAPCLGGFAFAAAAAVLL
ncbi:hypothetical protein CDD83_1045 [Cordyceps sp. RAO-2017]|nr:hypothetical protein CDD83_1045 [Cordyceps sp. RAO-2017]